MTDEVFMQQAIDLSISAVEHGNEPFGAVLVKDGRVVFKSENRIYTEQDPSFHAETGLMREFCSKTGIVDLREYTLYSSCEPCFMCSGMMVWLKLGRLVYAASNADLEELVGGTRSNCSAIVFENSFWQPRVSSGILRECALDVLRGYFSENEKG